MGIALLDSSTVIGFLDAEDALHEAADAAVRVAATEHVLAVSVVTIAELLTGAKLGHHDEQTVRRFFVEVISRRIGLNEVAAERAAELRAAHRALKMPDALILATAELHTDLALTGDEEWLKAPGLTCELRYIA
jgi:predicted nucleic acid-binding protein